MTANKNFGFLLRIKDKKTDRHPDMEGEIEIEGRKHILSGWVKISKKGNRYLSLSARPYPEDQEQDQDQNRLSAATPKPQKPGSQEEGPEAEIPF